MKCNCANIAFLLCAMQKRKVLVLGDIMLDRFIDGTVTRISPEAPVPILSQSQTRQMAGGAANVACNLAQLGLHVHLIGVCGDDAAARDLKTEVDNYPAIHFDPVKVRGRLTSLKTRYRSGGQQILRVDDEITSDIGEKDAKTFLSKTKSAFRYIAESSPDELNSALAGVSLRFSSIPQRCFEGLLGISATIPFS